MFILLYRIFGIYKVREVLYKYDNWYIYYKVREVL
jgi:hypothetical protein